ncbi:MAG: hypothetical protein OEZ48_01300 [Candidatus Bathyarchaeota archaeon]|nr:hypothetical protein [Candidatus Bathyarchaeota archaeon]
MEEKSKVSRGGKEMGNRQPRIRVYVAWEIISFSIVLSGLLSGNVVTVVFGTAMAFASTSAFLTQYVKSEHRVRRALEVASTFATLGIFIYGYAITRSFILGLITFFIVAIVFLAFTLSYLLPRIRREEE